MHPIPAAFSDHRDARRRMRRRNEQLAREKERLGYEQRFALHLLANASSACPLAVESPLISEPQCQTRRGSAPSDMGAGAAAGAGALIRPGAFAPSAAPESRGRHMTRSPRAGVEMSFSNEASVHFSSDARNEAADPQGVFGRLGLRLGSRGSPTTDGGALTIDTLQTTSATTLHAFTPAVRAASSYGTCSEINGELGGSFGASTPHESPMRHAAPHEPSRRASTSSDDEEEEEDDEAANDAPSLSAGREAALWRTLQASGLARPPA